MKGVKIWGGIGIFLMGCTSQIPLSTSLVKKYNLTPSDLSNLQVYVYNDRVWGTGEPAIRIYELAKEEKGREAQKVLVVMERAEMASAKIPNKTPCIITRALSDNAEKVAVRCFPDDPRELIFGRVEGAPTDYYYLYTITKDNVVYTRFGDTLVPVSSVSAKAYLKIDFRKVKKVEKREKVAKGIRL